MLQVGPVVGNPALNMVHWSRRLLPAEGSAASAASSTISVEGEAAGARAAPPAEASSSGHENGNGSRNGIVEPSIRSAESRAATPQAKPGRKAADGKALEKQASGDVTAAGKGRRSSASGGKALAKEGEPSGKKSTPEYEI